jgi:2-polyprenyl-6-methoxyphenol hydroxylase-like FAD-dependent oxidoreductase
VRKVAVVGAGQAGLQLALGLLRQGSEVTAVSNRTAEDIAAGRVMSSQCMFDAALQTERDLGLDSWAAECPDVDGIAFAIPGPDGGKAMDWMGLLDAPAQSVDQRVKVPGWMREFERSGGNLVIEEADVAALERYADSHDLVIVAAGKGQVTELFERDAEKSPYDAPQRALALTYVTGLRPRPEHSAVCFNLIPGVGEYFVFPALTTTGPCEIMVFEGVPGGPMDCWDDVTTPEQHLARSKEILEQFLPWEAERAADVKLTDDNGVLAGRLAPVVRKPVAALPSGRHVLGMGDAVVLNDPITGQGSNNAAKTAEIYLKAILDHGQRAFDEEWMQQAFDRYWLGYAHWVVTWTNAMLAPPPPHVLSLLGAAQQVPAIASRFVNGFNNPPDFGDWFLDPDKAAAYLAEVGG